MDTSGQRLAASAEPPLGPVDGVPSLIVQRTRRNQHRPSVVPHPGSRSAAAGRRLAGPLTAAIRRVAGELDVGAWPATKVVGHRRRSRGHECRRDRGAPRRGPRSRRVNHDVCETFPFPAHVRAPSAPATPDAVVTHVPPQRAGDSSATLAGARIATRAWFPFSGKSPGRRAIPGAHEASTPRFNAPAWTRTTDLPLRRRLL